MTNSIRQAAGRCAYKFIIAALVFTSICKPVIAEDNYPFDNLIVYITDADTQNLSPDDLESLMANLPNYLKISISSTRFSTVYEASFQNIVHSEYTLSFERNRLPCYNNRGDIQSSLDEMSMWLIDPARWEEVERETREMIEFFHCQASYSPLDTTTLRRIILYSAISYNLRADPERRDEELFRQAYALGTQEILGDGFDSLSDTGMWNAYTRSISGFQKAHWRVPVTISPQGVPYRTIFVDGELLQTRWLVGEPLRLYPGLHFIQLVDSRGQTRSATIEVPFDVPSFHIELRDQRLFAPRLEDVDEILWRKLRDEFFTIPSWLRSSLVQLQQANPGKKIYIVAPETPRLDGPGGRLLVGKIDGEIVDIAKSERGKLHISRKDVAPLVQLSYKPYPIVAGVGIGTSGTTATAVADIRRSIFRTDALDAYIGVLCQASYSVQIRARSGLLFGVTKENLDPNGGGWTYGLSFAVAYPSFNKEIPVSFQPRLHLGAEFPIERATDRISLRRRTVASLRFELIASTVEAVDLFDVQDRTGLSIQTMLSLRFWRARPLHGD